MLFRPGFPIGGGIGGLTFIYAVPVMLLGAALLYAELLPVEAGSQDTQEMEDFGDWYVSDVWAMYEVMQQLFAVFSIVFWAASREAVAWSQKIPQRSPRFPQGFLFPQVETDPDAGHWVTTNRWSPANRRLCHRGGGLVRHQGDLDHAEGARSTNHWAKQLPQNARWRQMSPVIAMVSPAKWLAHLRSLRCRISLKQNVHILHLLNCCQKTLCPCLFLDFELTIHFLLLCESMRHYCPPLLVVRRRDRSSWARNRERKQSATPIGDG